MHHKQNQKTNKMFAGYVTEEGLGSLIYKEILQINNQGLWI